MMGNTAVSWGAVSRWFHWSLGAAIIGMIAYGWWMNHFPARADRLSMPWSTRLTGGWPIG